MNSINIPLSFVPKGPIDNIPALVQIMAWHPSGDKPLSEPMMVSLLTHICVTRPQWVKCHCRAQNKIQFYEILPEVKHTDIRTSTLHHKPGSLFSETNGFALFVYLVSYTISWLIAFKKSYVHECMIRILHLEQSVAHPWGSRSYSVMHCHGTCRLKAEIFSTLPALSKCIHLNFLMVTEFCCQQI